VLLYQIIGKKDARDLIFQQKGEIIKELTLSGGAILAWPQETSGKLMKGISPLPGLPWREI
jgi:hypothetical protein